MIGKTKTTNSLTNSSKNSSLISHSKSFPLYRYHKLAQLQFSIVALLDNLSGLLDYKNPMTLDNQAIDGVIN